jgi:hypothetical protein
MVKGMRISFVGSPVVLAAADFCAGLAAFCARREPGRPVYLDPDAPIDVRVDDLVSRLTLEEKVAQMMNDAPAVERLVAAVPAFSSTFCGGNGDLEAMSYPIVMRSTTSAPAKLSFRRRPGGLFPPPRPVH